MRIMNRINGKNAEELQPMEPEYYRLSVQKIKSGKCNVEYKERRRHFEAEHDS